MIIDAFINIKNIKYMLLKGNDNESLSGTVGSIYGSIG